MKQLMNSKLFSLLTQGVENKQLLSEMTLAYDEFALKLQEQLFVDTDLKKLFYSISFFRLELVEVRNSICDGKGEKCLKNNN